MQIKSSDSRAFFTIEVGSAAKTEIAAERGLVLDVEVSEIGFCTARVEAWIGDTVWETFVADLKRCEKTRQGTASLYGFDPDTEQTVMDIEIKSLDGWGHFGLRYTLTKTDFSSAMLWENTVSGGFDIDMEFFVQMVRAFAEVLPASTRKRRAN